MKKIIAMLLVCTMAIGLFAACGGGNTEKPAETKPAATEAPAEAATEAPVEVKDITLKVWGPQEDQVDANSFLPVMCEKFNDAHPEWNITFVYEVCSEGDASKNVTQDPSAAADVYMFANDQLGTLIQANAIAQLGGTYLDQVLADNAESMIASVTGPDGGVYGVPFTGNTWFMYYDKSVFTEEDIKSLDTMLEKGKVSFPLTNSWWFASFYYANGCTIFGESTMDAAAGFDFGGDKGTAVTEYLVNLVKNPNFVVDADGAGMAGLRDGSVNVLFSGTWDAAGVREALGENFAAAQLPTITINGEAKQMLSFAGSKALGVNPNSQNMQAAVALAVYLGSAEAQLAHYEMRGIIPTSLALTEDATIKADPVALAQANTIANTSVLQSTLPEMGNYWTPSENMGKAIVSGEVTLDNAAEKTEAYNSALNNTGL
ncbi:MAG: extracellular solute-binding protein [Faecousia sp.]